MSGAGPEFGQKLKRMLSGIPLATIMERTGVTKQAVHSWYKTGRVAKKHLPVLSDLAGSSVDLLLRENTSSAPPAPAPNPSPQEAQLVQLNAEQIAVAQAWMDLPGNMRDEWREKLEEAAAPYRRRLQDQDANVRRIEVKPTARRR